MPPADLLDPFPPLVLFLSLVTKCRQTLPSAPSSSAPARAASPPLRSCSRQASTPSRTKLEARSGAPGTLTRTLELAWSRSRRAGGASCGPRLRVTATGRRSRRCTRRSGQTSPRHWWRIASTPLLTIPYVPTSCPRPRALTLALGRRPSVPLPLPGRIKSYLDTAALEVLPKIHLTKMVTLLRWTTPTDGGAQREGDRKSVV